MNEQNSGDLIGAGFTQMLGNHVHIVSNPKDNTNTQQMTQVQLTGLHSTFLVSHPMPDDKAIGEVEIKTMLGQTIPIAHRPNATVLDIKKSIEKKKNLSVEKQKLILSSIQLENDRQLKEYKIKRGTRIHLADISRNNLSEKKSKEKSNQDKIDDQSHYVLDESGLHPEFDYDLSKAKPDRKVFYRGGEKYERPIGWKRLAIRVKDKYEDNAWLGIDGLRTESSENEWPVSYHAMKFDGIENVLKQANNIDKKNETELLQGQSSAIVSSPDPQFVAKNAVKFTLDGKNFEMMIQNRVNRKKLIKVPSSESNMDGECWIVPSENDIRPYGICFREVK
eukprot:gb/GECH01006217.1/.p1 GENE.gb/GECH01006217.1/~~gb/GECH01006217.1/.p1  ORF type:complete len:336 (+),score=89.29 gb/GECH01006217.1/:1-1008(+)